MSLRRQHDSAPTASAPAPGTPSPAVERLAAEFILGFLTHNAALSGGDFLDGTLRIAILDANIAHLRADLEIGRRYAEFDHGPPDELRRAVSINALAGSLALPFETTRRRVHALADRGMVTLTPDGVILTLAQLSGEDMRSFAQWIYDALVRLHHDLVALAPDFAATRPQTPMDGAEAKAPPLRAVARATMGYVLRYLESARPVAGDLISAIVFLALAVGSVEHITHAQDASDAFSRPGVMVPDTDRRRLTVKAVADRLGLPFETVRRRVNSLVAQGLCTRDRQGLYIPASVLMSPVIVAHRAADAANLHRLFATVVRLGLKLD